jgi:hypothetical protein
MGMLRVLSRHGDDRVAWDVKQVEPVRIDEFDRTAEQIVMVPRVVGG